MLNQFEPNVKATISFLKLINVKVTNSTVNETLQNHPDWPSLLCISDSLNKWNVPNGAGKINVENINELPIPFIAHTKNKEFPLAIITEVSATSIKQLSNKNNKITNLSKENFFKDWDGVYLLAEPNNQSGEKNYQANKNKELVNVLMPISTLLLFITFSAFIIIKSLAAIGQNQASISNAIFFQYLISLAGLLITSLLLWYEIDKNNPLLQKVCTGIAKGNCNAIITGKQAKVFSWLSWSEVGFFYFCGAFLLLLFSGNQLLNSFLLIGLFNILALPYTIFSIYYQWKIARQWCVLCLMVQLLLLLGFLNIILNIQSIVFLGFSLPIIYKIIILYMLPILVWYTIKPYMLKLQQEKLTKRAYLRIKFNEDVFKTLLQKQFKNEYPTDNLGIDLGSKNPENTIIKVCSPTCEPCAVVHPEIDEMINKIANLKVKIIFTTPNDPAHHAFKPAYHLLALDEQKTNESEIQNALDDWYLGKKKDFEKFASTHQLNQEAKNIGNKMNAMEKWCKNANVYKTPTFFLNNYQLPELYTVTDLKYFLSE